MNITELKKTLEQYPDRKLRFVLPDKSAIPTQCHITEVGHVRKDFIDCGGTERSVSSCVLQAWVAANDEDHSLEAGKLAKILKLGGKILADDQLPVEVEFEAPYISQFPIESAKIEDGTLVFHLASKHTDCLAKEQCGLASASSCGSAETGCC